MGLGPEGQSAPLGASSFIRTLLNDADAATAQATLGVSANPHGAADHTNITRSFWLDPESATMDSGTLATVGTTPEQVRVVALADALVQGCQWSFTVPADWDSGVLTAQPVWLPGSTDASSHSVRWAPVCKELAAGVDSTAAGTATPFDGASAARTANVTVYDTATSLGVTPSAAGNAVRLTYRRNGASGTDTYVGTVNLLGVIISYTASQ